MKKKYLTSLLVVIIYYNFFVLNADENYLNNKEKNYGEHSYSELKSPKSRLLIQKKNNEIKKDKKKKIILKKKNKEKISKSKEDNKILDIKTSDKKIIINYIQNEIKPSQVELNKFKNNILNLDIEKNIIIRSFAKKREGDSSSDARRLSLKRALFIKSILLNYKFNNTKIQIKALGNDNSIDGNKDVIFIREK